MKEYYYWLNKALNVSKLMGDYKYKDRLIYLAKIQRFFIKMFFRCVADGFR